MCSAQGTNAQDVAMIQNEYNIYVEAHIISHSAEVTGFPGPVQPPLSESIHSTLCSGIVQHNEIQIEFLLLPYRLDKSPESSVVEKMREQETAQDRALGISFLFFPALTKSQVSVAKTCNCIQCVSIFVPKSCRPSFVQPTETAQCAHFALLYVVFDALFRFLMPLICLTSPGTSSLATWTGMTTLTVSLWGECHKSSLPLSSHVILLFLHLVLPSVSYLSRSGLTCNASLCN